MQPTQIDPTEEWRPVPGFEGRYEVSSHGRVWSHIRHRLLKPQPRGWGHLYVTLGGRGYGVHQLVALAFIGPRPEGQLVRHWDGNHLNNHATNLRYGTQLDNMDDQRRHGTQFWANKTHCPQGHPYDEANTGLDSEGHRRCLTCTRAQQRAKRRNLQGSGPIPHGRNSKYTAEGCRCDLCRAAHAAANRKRK